MPPWTAAILTIRGADAIVAIVPFDGRLCVAAERIDEMGDRPSGLARLSPNEPGRWGSVSGRCGSWYFSAGYLPAPAGGGAGWRVVDDGEVWIACGPDTEAPDVWRLPDGSDSPTGFAVWGG